MLTKQPCWLYFLSFFFSILMAKVLFYCIHLSIIRSCIHPSPLNVPTLLMVELFSICFLTHSSSLNCFLTISTVIPASLSSDIFKPSPWGEQKPASIWNQLFCSVHESRTKPWQKNSCKDRCVICFCLSYRLCCYQSIYCAALLQLWTYSGPEALQHIKAVANMQQGQMARNDVGTNEINPNYNW